MFVSFGSPCRYYYCRLIEFNEQLSLKVESRACLYNHNTVLQMLHLPAVCALGTALCVSWRETPCVRAHMHTPYGHICIPRVQLGDSVSDEAAIRHCNSLQSRLSYCLTYSFLSVCAAVIWGFDRLSGECVRWR